MVPHVWIGDPCRGTEYHKGTEVTGKSHFPDSHCGSRAVLLGMLKPVTPENSIFYWNLQLDVPFGWLSYSTALGEGGATQSPLVSYCPAASQTYWKPTSGMEHALKRENWGILVWHYQPPVHFLILDRAASLSEHIYGLPMQFKFLQLPTSVSLRRSGHILFSTDRSFGQHLYSLHWSGGPYTMHGVLTKFIQEALNHSQQNLTLLNTGIFLMRNAVLPK